MLKNIKTKKITSIIILASLIFSVSYADDLLDVKNDINNMRNSVQQPGILGNIFTTVFDTNGKIKEVFLSIVDTALDGYIPMWSNLKLVNSPLFFLGGKIGIGTITPSETLTLSGGLSITKDPDTGDDVGDRDYNDARYLGITTQAVDSDKVDGLHAAALTQGQTATPLNDTNDLNLLNDGWYSWLNVLPLNAPSGYMIMVQQSDGVQKIQMTFGSATSGKIYVRRADNGIFYPWSEFQQRITGTCTSGSSIRIINSDGTVTCESELDPEVGINTIDYLSKWDGNALVTSNIFDNGKIGIGRSDPGAKLDIDARLNGSGLGLIVDRTTRTSGEEYVRFGTTTSADLMVNTTGNVGIGTLTPSEKLSVSGIISVTSDPNSDDDIGNRLYNDGRYLSITGTAVNSDKIDNYDSKDIRSTNLLEGIDWVVGTSGSSGKFTQNGTTAENLRVWGINPYGNRGILWEAIPDSGSDADGGWVYDMDNIDDTKPYRLSVWIKKTGSINGTTYIGTGLGVLNLDDTTNSNPYFWTGELPELDKWYLLVGYIHGSGDTSTINYGGVYDGITGKKVLNITDFKMSLGQTQLRHRTYLYYDVEITDRQYWWGPRVDLVNGNEPSIQSLISIDYNLYDTTADTIADDGIIQETEMEQNSIDDSEIQDNSLTAISLATSSVETTEILDNTITETDISDSFIARDSSKVGGKGIGYLDVEAENGGLYIGSPGGAKYKSTTSTLTGAIAITLPTTWSNTMMRMTVDIYDHDNDESITLNIGGYNYATSPAWYKTFAQINSSLSNKDFNVRFGDDGTNNVIYIGETTSTWRYPQVVVRDFYAGYSGTEETRWDDNWSIGITTTLGTIYATESANYPYSDWNKIKDIPVGFADGIDDNTQLSEATVDSYVSNNGYDTTPDTIADDGIIDSSEIQDNTITETDISDSFIARDSNLLDGLDSTDFTTKQKTTTQTLNIGWYTIAKNNGNRASAKFILKDTTSGYHQSVNFYAQHHYGNGNVITTLADSPYSNGGTFRYIRIKEGATYDGAVLQVYIDTDGSTVYAEILENIQTSGWDVIDWALDGTLTTPDESILTQAVIIDLDINNGIQTTDNINAQGGYKVDGIIVVGSDAYLEGDRIRQNTVDDSEIQDDSLTAISLAANSVGDSELIDTPTVTQLNISSGNDNGVRFWGSDSYEISMSNGTTHLYGPVTDYSIKTNMSNTTGRGFTWGVTGVAPTTGLAATTGDFQTAGSIRAEGGFNVDGNQVIDSNAGWHRSYGATGWYNNTYGGGWYMTDSTWLRAYNDKAIITGNEIQGTIFKDNNNTSYYVDPSGESNIYGLTIDSARIKIARDAVNYSWIQATGTGADIDRVTFGFKSDPGSGNVTQTEIYSNGVAGIVLSSSGNVGIGSNVPSTKLEVFGTTTTNYLIVNPQDGTNEGGELQLKGAGTYLDTQIDNYQGNVRVHTLDTGKYLDVLGGAGVRANGYVTNSDRRYKKDIIPLKSSLEKINKLNGYNFTWKDTGSKDVGIIAQEVEKIFPNLVLTNDENGMKAVKYSNLVAPIIEAIKELTNKIDVLFNKYFDQENRINNLEKRLYELELKK